MKWFIFTHLGPSYSISHHQTLEFGHNFFKKKIVRSARLQRHLSMLLLKTNSCWLFFDFKIQSVRIIESLLCVCRSNFQPHQGVKIVDLCYYVIVSNRVCCFAPPNNLKCKCADYERYDSMAMQCNAMMSQRSSYFFCHQ